MAQEIQYCNKYMCAHNCFTYTVVTQKQKYV